VVVVVVLVATAVLVVVVVALVVVVIVVVVLVVVVVVVVAGGGVPMRVDSSSCRLLYTYIAVITTYQVTFWVNMLGLSRDLGHRFTDKH
jgi:hypothetical protein